MNNTFRKIKRRVNQYLRPESIRDIPRDRIRCIRYTITWRCNFKCTSCDIWKIENPKENKTGRTRIKDELTVSEVDRFTKTSFLSDVDEIVISGGEPTLRNDFPELMLALHRNMPKAKFTITINGYDPDRTVDFLRTIRRESKKFEWACIGVSLNGTKEVHDPSRGYKDSYEKVLETAQRVKEFCPNVGFSFTFLKENVREFYLVKKLAKKMGLSLHLCWTVMNDRFVAEAKDLVFQRDPSLISILEKQCDLSKIRETYNPVKDFQRNKGRLRMAYLYDSIINQRVMPCNAAQTFFHLAPYGDVYPCNFDLRPERILGNVKEDSINRIMSRVSSPLLNEISCGDCMYPNGSLCGDSDINRSIRQTDSVVTRWYKIKRGLGTKLIRREPKLQNFEVIK